MAGGREAWDGLRVHQVMNGEGAGRWPGGRGDGRGRGPASRVCMRSGCGRAMQMKNTVQQPPMQMLPLDPQHGSPC
jgi:hypothetical protein